MSFGNTFDTTNPGSGTLNREDLSDDVTILEPEETPIYSMANKQSCTATLPEWGVDRLDNPANGANGVLEGLDVPAFSDQHADKAKLSNRAQKHWATWMVSDIQNAVNSAGGASATTSAGAKAKALRNLKRYVEYSLNSDNTVQAGDGDTPALMSGLGDWINTSPTVSVPTDYRTPTASIETAGAATTEAEFNTVLRSMYQNTGYNGGITLFAATTLREQISNFTRINGGGTNEVRYQVNEDASAKKISLQVNIFESDFGYVTIVNSNPDCAQAQDRGYLLPMDLIAIKSLIGASSFDLEDKGGGERGFVKCVETLCVKNPLGCGKIT